MCLPSIHTRWVVHASMHSTALSEDSLGIRGSSMHHGLEQQDTYAETGNNTMLTMAWRDDDDIPQRP